MRRLFALTCAAMLTLGTSAALADTMLYTTMEDFVEWEPNDGTSMIATGVNTGSIGSNPINGLGNTTAPGLPGTDGSLSVQWVTGAYNFFFGPGEQANTAFLAALGTDSTGQGLTAASGQVAFEYTVPPPGNGNYFELNLVLNYNNNFGQFSGSSVDNGNGTFTRYIDYTINALAPGSLSYFQLGVIYNSNYDTTTPFTVDNVRVVPEPATLVLLPLAGLLLRRRCS